ncbi:MAG: hypothetical protein DRR42_05900 [Gammaproteobacteria bacterium]|nr:MAG: hypothetical protein DRR42_05900 [Gammaproteobacteria bacterium]
MKLVNVHCQAKPAAPYRTAGQVWGDFNSTKFEVIPGRKGLPPGPACSPLRNAELERRGSKEVRGGALLLAEKQ